MHTPTSAMEHRAASWGARAATVSDALHSLLTAAVTTAADPDRDGNVGRLHTAVARFDTLACSLEQDLTDLAQKKSTKRRTHGLPTQMLRQLAEHEEHACPR